MDCRGRSKNPTIKALIEIMVDNATKIRKNMLQILFYVLLDRIFSCHFFLLFIVSSRTSEFVNYVHFGDKVL